MNTAQELKLNKSQNLWKTIHTEGQQRRHLFNLENWVEGYRKQELVSVGTRVFKSCLKLDSVWRCLNINKV